MEQFVAGGPAGLVSFTRNANGPLHQEASSTSKVTDLAFSHNEEFPLLVSIEDNNLRVWDVSNLSTVQTIPGLPGPTTVPMRKILSVSSFLRMVMHTDSYRRHVILGPFLDTYPVYFPVKRVQRSRKAVPYFDWVDDMLPPATHVGRGRSDPCVGYISPVPACPDWDNRSGSATPFDNFRILLGLLAARCRHG